MQIDKQLLALGREARELRSSHRGGRFLWPKEIRKSVLGLVRAGAQPKAIERATGISMSTYRYWIDVAPKPGFQELKLQPRVQSQPAPMTRVAIRTRSGTEISGLTVEHLERLLERGLLS